MGVTQSFADTHKCVRFTTPFKLLYKRINIEETVNITHQLSHITQNRRYTIIKQKHMNYV